MISFAVSASAKDTEIWFLDRALYWHFLTDTFTAYYRLLITHLGLPQWQYAFTNYGVSPQAKVRAACHLTLDTVSEFAEAVPTLQTLSFPVRFKEIWGGAQRPAFSISKAGDSTPLSGSQTRLCLRVTWGVLPNYILSGPSSDCGFWTGSARTREREKSVSYFPALQPPGALPHRRPLFGVSQVPSPRHSTACGFWFLFPHSQVQPTATLLCTFFHSTLRPGAPSVSYRERCPF